MIINMESEIDIYCKDHCKKKDCTCLYIITSLIALILFFFIGVLVQSLVGIVAALTLGAVIVLLITLLILLIISLILLFCCKKSNKKKKCYCC